MENKINMMMEKLKDMGADKTLNAAVGKLKEMGGENMINISTEKLKELLPLLQNIAGQFMGRLDETFPTETGKDRFRWISVFGPIIVIALVVLLVFFSCFYRRKPGNLMKAPGMNARIERKAFEANPKMYFRKLHGASKKRN